MDGGGPVIIWILIFLFLAYYFKETGDKDSEKEMKGCAIIFFICLMISALLGLW